MMLRVRFVNDEESAIWEDEETSPYRAALNFLDYIFYECEGHSWMLKYESKPQVRVEDSEGNINLYKWDVELLPSFQLFRADP